MAAGSTTAHPRASRPAQSMAAHRTPTRRDMLRGFGVTAALGALAACSKSDRSAAVIESGGGAPHSEPTMSGSGTRVLDVRTFGAVGDGTTDDTAAIAKALAALQPGQILMFPAGKTFAHSAVLTVRTAGVRLMGPGTLAATNEQASALKIEAANVVVVDLTLTCAKTTKRWDAPDQHKLFLGAHDGITVREVIVKGSAAAGVFCLGASNFTLQSVQVSDTRADGIHLTYGCKDGSVISPMITRSGDDGVAVVSYLGDHALCQRIKITNPTVASTTGGRGISVVGGQSITYTDINVSDSDAAAVYIACEGAGSSPTYPVSDVKVTGGTITGANTDAGIDHGAVLVYSGRSGGSVGDVVVSGLTISKTRAGASRQIGVVTDNGGTAAGVQFVDLHLDATPRPYQGDGPAGSFRLSGVTAAGQPVPAAG